ncbi:hypothetical protein KUTeg_005205 [Tegillarca granosa]|uniref:Uncharacterized protein n=1 Tax=Tegillarca granosa TaxID=220873 RepID=A0ABQ9FJ36_TEGGR|nr:hypothetical protein KUTeg_005205 [Tegillarca granosa]
MQEAKEEAAADIDRLPSIRAIRMGIGILVLLIINLHLTHINGEITLDEFENKLVEMGFEDRQYSIFTALDSDVKNKDNYLSIFLWHKPSPQKGVSDKAGFIIVIYELVNFQLYRVNDGKITQKEFDLVTPGVANDILFPECVKTIYNYMQP